MLDDVPAGAGEIADVGEDAGRFEGDEEEQGRGQRLVPQGPAGERLERPSARSSGGELDGEQNRGAYSGAGDDVERRVHSGHDPAEQDREDGPAQRHRPGPAGGEEDPERQSEEEAGMVAGK